MQIIAGQMAKSNAQKNRDIQRMYEYNEKKAGDSWAAQDANYLRYDEAKSRNTARTSSVTPVNEAPSKNRPFFRPKPNKPPAAEKPLTQPEKPSISKQPDYRSKTAQKPMDEPLYDIGQYSTMVPVNDTISHNLDYSGFHQVMVSTYEQFTEADPRFRRALPFCIFQHYCVEILNAHLIDLAKRNGNPTFMLGMDVSRLLNLEELYVPKPIAEYLASISNSVTEAHDSLLVNLPVAGTPQPPVNVPQPAPIPDVRLPSGTFGAVNVNSHNAYETYWSPYVTRRLIEQTIAANGAGQNPAPWNPFPNGAVTAQGNPNLNLLGYAIPERLNQEGLQQLAGITFTDDATIAGRLCHSPAVIQRTNSALANLTSKVPMNKGMLKMKMSSGVIGFLETNVSDGSARITDMPARVLSSEQLSAVNSGRTYITGLKRRRSDIIHGACWADQAWIPTRNDNFAMVGTFAPTVGTDRPTLRLTLAVENPAQIARTLAVSQWVRNSFPRK